MENSKEGYIFMEHTMKEDPLQIIMTFIKDVTGHIGFKLTMVVSIVYIQLFNAVGFFIAYNDESREPLNYLSSFLLPQMAIYTTFLVIRDFTKNKMKHIQQNILGHLFPINICGKNVERQVLRYCKTVKLLSIAFSVTVFQNLTLSIYWFDMIHPDMNLIGLTISTYFRQISSLLQTVTFISYLVITYGCIILPIYVSYCISHIKIQMILLRSNLARISQDVNNLKLMHDGKYQNTVRLILRQSVILHLNLKKLAKEFIQTAPDAIVANPLLGTLAFVSIAYFIQMRIYPKADIGDCLFVITGALITYVYISYGQLLEDETGSLFLALTQCSWVVWNGSNRRNLLIFLINAKPMRLSAYNVIHVNAVLVINIMSTGYKILLCFNQLLRNRSKL